MIIRNSYPEKPIVEFCKISVEMAKIENILKLSTAHREVKAAALVIIRNETGNCKSVINNTNISGVQSDSGRWASIWDNKIVATCQKNEGMTGKLRGFVVFDKLETGIDFLIDRIENKGLFIGEKVDSRYYNGNVTTPEQLAVAYHQEWVMGDKSQPSAQMIKDFVSMYKQAILKFS